MQLSLVAELWNAQKMDMEKSADAPHVLCLWAMSKEKRMLLWKELQPQLQLRELELGGEWFKRSCPVDDEELTILCPEGCLHDLQRLFLHHADRVTDCGLRTLVLAGCGAQLKSLTLSGD